MRREEKLAQDRRNKPANESCSSKFFAHVAKVQPAASEAEKKFVTLPTLRVEVEVEDEVEVEVEVEYLKISIIEKHSLARLTGS